VNNKKCVTTLEGNMWLSEKNPARKYRDVPQYYVPILLVLNPRLLSCGTWQQSACTEFKVFFSSPPWTCSCYVCNFTLSSVICISLLQLHDFLIFDLSVPDIVYKNNLIIHLMFRACGVTFCLRFYAQLYLKICTYAASPDNICPFPCPYPPPNLTFGCINMA